MIAFENNTAQVLEAKEPELSTHSKAVLSVVERVLKEQADEHHVYGNTMTMMSMTIEDCMKEIEKQLLTTI